MSRFVELDWREALRHHADGRQVLKLDSLERPEGVTDDWIAMDLDDVLPKRAHYQVDMEQELLEEQKQEEQKQEAADDSPGFRPKRYYVREEDKKKIDELYRSGREMEEIAEALGLYLSAVSRYIKEAGLGDERYKGKVIPSTGSAPVTAAVYNGGTGKKGN